MTREERGRLLRQRVRTRPMKSAVPSRSLCGQPRHSSKGQRNAPRPADWRPPPKQRYSIGVSEGGPIPKWTQVCDAVPVPGLLPPGRRRQEPSPLTKICLQLTKKEWVR
jgi:hypothetical protein